MPSTVVRTKPAGSLDPGDRNLAMMPAANPMMIVQMMPMADPHDLARRNVRWGPPMNRSCA